MQGKKEFGLVQVFTGTGKGKTTAALGLAMRALGHGFRVHMIQFMKGRGYAGELAMASKLSPLFSISQFGRGCRYGALIRQGHKNVLLKTRVLLLMTWNMFDWQSMKLRNLWGTRPVIFLF